MLKNIIQGIIASIIVGLLGWIALSVKDVPGMKDDFKTYKKDEWNRYVDLNTRLYNIEKAYERQRIIDSIKGK